MYLGTKINNSYFPLLLILPLKIKNDQKLFEIKQKRNDMIDESEESNILDYVKQINTGTNTIEEEQQINELYNKISKEEVIVIFFKVRIYILHIK